MNKDDAIVFEDSMNIDDNHSALVGEISIYRRNKTTGEKILHEKSKNVISISGYQWILMKMFGLYLDSYHGAGSDADDMGQDSTIIIPDLNNDTQLGIGVAPTEYTKMEENISSNHFIQGFMVGNGGSAEDAITAKNTNYSFIKLRNPIPFRQTTASNALTATEANRYLGVHRPPASSSSGVKSYFIKKFDDTPHIYHSWWKDDERWDYVDPVTENDLGPDASNGQGKSNRIETYVETHLSLDENDCTTYFNQDGNTGSAVINELGLVAFDTIPGVLSIVEKLYDTHVSKFIKLVYSNNEYDEETISHIVTLANDIITVLNETLGDASNTHITEFIDVLNDIISAPEGSSIDFDTIKTNLCSVENIEVDPSYSIDHTFKYSTDKFKEYTDAAAYTITGGDTPVTDEAQRIKLITYYTFNALPIQSDWEILIYYRIYAN